MGQGQSSGSASDAQATVKTSYYELLGVERQATEDEIKKAYRRKALELHPDRNYGREDEATKLFSDIQAAYEVLSDPQERAWYDGHESAILRGGEPGDEHFEGSVKVTTSDDVLAMIGKFNGRVRFDDSPDGFFGYLNEAFERMAREEQIAADLEDLDVEDFPSFGHKADTHEVVQVFYRGWASFSTKKSFAWMDIYRLNEAPERRVRKLMEKENQKLRDKAKKEFNDSVRTLVQFVRRRDPRYMPNVQSEAERQKALREASAAQAARARAANAAKMDGFVPEWAKVREPEKADETSEEESEEEQFECVACYKTFKSERQFEAHEKSKKHQKAVQALRRKMQKENKNLNLDDDVGTSSGIVTPAEVDEEHSIIPGEEVPDVKQLDLDDEEREQETLASKRLDDESQREKSSESESDGEDSDYASLAKVKSRLSDTAAFPTTSQEESEESEAPSLEESSLSHTLVDSDNESIPQPAQKKLGKAAQKRAKKAAKAVDADAEESKFTCAVCSAAFPSKTRMFQHIKDLGHAAPPSQVGKKKGKGKK